MYEIMGKYAGETEIIDETDNLEDAKYLVGEYQMAFGAGWEIWYEH